MGGVQVKNQSVLIAAHWGQRKDLWLNRLFQIKHHAHHTRTVLSHTHARDVGIVRFDFTHPLPDRGVEFKAFNVNGQAGGGGHKSVFGFERYIRL